jgi:hypothetical protein
MSCAAYGSTDVSSDTQLDADAQTAAKAAQPAQNSCANSSNITHTCASMYTAADAQAMQGSKFGKLGPLVLVGFTASGALAAGALAAGA